MKQFLIKYRLKNGSPDAWHADIARFIAALNADPALKGISYRCMKHRDGNDYYHLATVADDAAVTGAFGDLADTFNAGIEIGHGHGLYHFVQFRCLFLCAGRCCPYLTPSVLS